MTKRISELPAAAAISDADEFEVNQGGASRKATRAQIVGGLAGAAHQHGLADITDGGALAALDSVGAAQIDAAAFASQADAIAGIDNAKIMTPLRTAEAIAAAPPAAHQHSLADLTDSGALAALDIVGTAEIDDAAYASQPEAVAGSDNSKIMTALRTAEAIAALAPEHQHTLSDITDAGTLAALDLIGAGEIEPNAVTSGKIVAGAVTMDKLADQAVVASKLATNAVTETKIASAAVTEAKIADGAVTQSKIVASAYASQGEAVAGTDNAKLMTPLRTAEAIAVLAATHQHTLADIADSGALAALDIVGTGEVDAAAYASHAEATAGTDGAKLMTPLRTAQAITARAARPFSPILDEEDYSSTPFAVTDSGNQRRYFLDAHDHIIEFPAGLAADPAAYGVFTAPPGNPLTLRRAADSGVSINGVASNVYTWVVPAGGTVEWQVRATNTIELRGDTTAEQLLVGPLDANDQTIARPHLIDVTEGYADAGSKSGAASFDYEAGGWQKCVAVGDLTSVAVANAPTSGRVGSLTLEIHQDGTGNRSIAWGAAFRFPGGAGSALSTAANAIDIFTLTTRDGGTTWYVFEGGKAFAA
jgi:hypothetical protein